MTSKTTTETTLTGRITALAGERPCQEAIDWLAGRRSLARAWRDCQRADWLLWLAGRVGVDRRELVLAACDCAEMSLGYVPAKEDRPRAAIETARRWARGEATADDAHAAASASAAASAAATTFAAYAYAAYAAYAASASAAASAAAYAHASAHAYAYAHAYASAAYAASASAAAAAAAAPAARATMLRLVRQRWPECPVAL